MSSLLARTPARTAVLSRGAGEGTTSGVFARGGPDPTMTLDYHFLLSAGSTMNAAKRRGPVLTFTRASAAMGTFDENGTMVWAPEQLLDRTNDFSHAGWAVTRVESVTSGQADSDGGTAADLIEASADGSSGTQLRQALSTGSGNGNNVTFTLSVIAKNPSTNPGTGWLFVRVQNGDADQFVTFFDLVNGVKGSDEILSDGVHVASDMTSLGDGFYRCSITGRHTAGNSTTTAVLGIGEADGDESADDGDQVILYKPYASRTSISSSRYIENTGSSPVYGEPRFDHDPANSDAAIGLMIEEARTNLQVNSEAFDNVAWTKTNLTVNADDIAAPDGNTTAERITDDTTNGQHTISDGITIASGANTAFSVFAKAGTHDFLHITYRNANEVFISAAFDISSGSTETAATDTHVGTTSGTIVTTSQQNVGGGWFRCTLVGSVAATNGSFYIGLAEAATGNSWSSDGFPTYTGTTETAHIWGASAELGAFALSYIPTTTASVTRAKDVCSTTDVSWHSGGASTWFAQFSQPVLTGNDDTVLQIDDGGTSDLEELRVRAGNKPHFRVVSSAGNGAEVITADTISAGTTVKLAAGYTTDDLASTMDGATVKTDSTVDFPVGFTTFHVGANHADGDTLDGHIAQIKYWNVRKPNAFLVSVTS